MKFLYGLIGKKLSHSFSKNYFSEKFEKEGLKDHAYELFELPNINSLPSLLHQQPQLKGLNVTIPYKEEVLPFMNKIDDAAGAVGAVNTIKIRDGKLTGFNTDVYGFNSSLTETLGSSDIRNALILGTGGASKAVQVVLGQLNISYKIISRRKTKNTLSYDDLNAAPELIKNHRLIINTTPLGMYPAVDKKPSLPYHFITENHIFFDLVYNPDVTAFLNEGAHYGAKIKNGLDMLHYQAEHAWRIWNDDDL
jgi:shikimate dehydrogenase